MGENIQTSFGLNLIKILLKSLIHFHGVRLNTIDPMMLIKFMIKNLIQDQPENSHKMILHLIYTKKVSKKCFKIEIKEKYINYVQIDQEITSKSIEKSEIDPNDFINFLVIF